MVQTESFPWRLTLMLLLLFILNATIPPAKAGDEDEEANTSAVPFSQCPSRTLLIGLNIEDSANKYALVRAIKIMARYPDFRFVPIKTASPLEAAFTATAVRVCTGDEEACFNSMGWTAIQEDLEGLVGVTLSCDSPE